MGDLPHGLPALVAGEGFEQFLELNSGGDVVGGSGAGPGEEAKGLRA